MTPLPTPDTLRKTLKMLKHFYSGYTDRYKGYTDVDGYKYNGTIENFGSEIYLEARKILMERPPIESVFPGNTFNFYFNISYSELIGTYEQQNMFIATLKENVLRSDCIYKIIFRNCEKRYVLRSQSWSDPDVYHDTFVMTESEPVLQIQIPNGSEYDIEEINLSVSNNDSYNIIYSFNLNKSNYDPERPDSDLVESYDEETGVLTTRPLTFRDVNIPVIWIYSDAFNILPDIGFVDNVDKNGETLLTIGTDGHDKSHLYPLIYPDNYPDTFDPEDGLHWFLKVLPVDGASFVDDSVCDINYSTEVKTITFIRSENPWSQPVISKTISYDNTFTKIFIEHDIDWQYHKPEETEYDYDDTSRNNPTYAYISLDDFESNTDEELACLSCFYVTFDVKHLNPYEPDQSNIVSGIHIETCSDYSDNAVLKKNGFIHSLGDFDGLPDYYKYLGEKDEHRSHVEMYSIRDYVNDNNKKVTDKQTVAIVLDSGISQKDFDNVVDDLNKVIMFNFSGEREWFSVGESTSATNVLSSLVFDEGRTFADDKVPGMGGKTHLIYHGNRYLSTDIIELDPGTQYGRAMLINNDPAVYENNGKTNFKKPLRTIARICDIPTEFSQLIHITGISPTIIIDEDYIHQDASMNDEDKDRLWNVLENKWVTSINSLCSLGIFDKSMNLDSILPITSDTDYTRKINLNTYVSFSSCTVEIGTGGTGYAIDDTFSFYVGGVLVTGIVTDVNDTAVYEVSLDLDPAYRINIANLSSSITSFNTTTVNGNGSGLKVDIIVPSELWNSLQMTRSNIPYDDLFTLKFDEYGFLWFWKYDTNLSIWRQNDQLTGPKIVPNSYDDKLTLKQRSCGNVMLYNMLNVRNVLHDDEINYSSQSGVSPVPVMIPIENLLSFSGPNYQSSYYTIDNFPPDQYQQNYRVSYWNHFEYTDNTKILPAYNQLNLSNHSIRGDAIQWLTDDTVIQPLMMYYNPTSSNIVQYDRICDNIWNVTEDRPMTYRDILGDDWIDEHGVAIAPIYRYNEFKPTTDYTNIQTEISVMTHNELISYIESNFPDSFILQLEGSEQQLPDEEIKLYIMDNWYNNPVYKCNDIYRTHEMNETVVLDDMPVGEAPSGNYVPLVETHRDPVKFNNEPFIAEITLLFKLDTIMDLNGFVIQNDEGIDVSHHALILMNNHFYYYNENDIWTVIP